MLAAGRSRRPGVGRQAVTVADPHLAVALDLLVDPATRGDPMSALGWTAKSTRNLADSLTADGHRVSDQTVARLLKAAGYRLQGNTTAREGRQHR